MLYIGTRTYWLICVHVVVVFASRGQYKYFSNFILAFKIIVTMNYALGGDVLNVQHSQTDEYEYSRELINCLRA